jgi:hypothetical protein
MDNIQYITSAVAGLLAGVIGSLVAPWVNWGIEARRERMKSRRALLEEARRVLSDPPPVAEFRRMPIYFKVKHLLSPATRKAVDGKFDEWGNEVLVIVRGGPHGGLNPYAHQVLHDLSEIEKEWNLV